MPEVQTINFAITVLLVGILLVSLGQLFAAMNRDNRLTRRHDLLMQCQTFTRYLIDRKKAVTPTHIEVIGDSELGQRVERLVKSQHLIESMAEQRLPCYVTITDVLPVDKCHLVSLTLWDLEGTGRSQLLSDRLHGNEITDETLANAINFFYQTLRVN